MRPGQQQQADIVRVPPTARPPPAPAGKGSLLRQHGLAGVVMACYVFALVFLQLGLMKFGKKSVLDSC
jgi:hypothetical protein